MVNWLGFDTLLRSIYQSFEAVAREKSVCYNAEHTCTFGHSKQNQLEI